MLKQNLSQRLLQKLSPQQIQLMKLLQIPTATLEQRIKEELEANPVLEEGEDRDEQLEVVKKNDDADDHEEKDQEEEIIRDEEFELDDYLTEYIEDDPSSYKLKANNFSAEEEDKSIPIAVEDTFHEYLEQQLGMMKLKDEREVLIAQQIIGSIDDDGYLRREPPGIGARDLQECLLLQLNHRSILLEHIPHEEKASLRLATRIIKDYFNEFSKKHYQKLQRNLSISEKQLKFAVDEILRLNPKPASGHRTNNTRGVHYIVPDFIIVNREGELDLSLNSRNAPDLRINEHYKDMLKSYKDSRAGKRKL